jgi:hypothetical protein
MHQRDLKSKVHIMKGDMRNKDTIARILIADSNSLFREKIKQIIADIRGMQ